MSRKRGPEFDPAELARPGSLHHLIAAHLDDMAVRHYSERTIPTRRHILLRFGIWLRERDITHGRQIARSHLQRYQRHLYHHRKANGKPLSIHTQRHHLQAVQSFLRWCVRKDYLGADPSVDLDKPRPIKNLPITLSEEELGRIFAIPSLTSPEGLRNRAILEVLYSTGIRRAEAAGLQLHDIDAAKGIVRVVQGKGRKDRVVPIGKRALDWIDRYLTHARPEARPSPDEQHLFLSIRTGLPLSPDNLGERIRQIIKAAELPHLVGGCHLFRHTMATRLLENGCDIRLIQDILGHAELSTTAMYTHVGITHLKAAHSAFHPAENNRRDSDESDR